MAKTERRRKLTTAEYMQAMDDHEISYEGRTDPEQWSDYADLFQEIRRIGDIKPDRFYAQYDQDDPVIVHLQETASKLEKRAWFCLNDLDTEDGWRKEVEFLVFECFEQEIICLHCWKRRWKPIFEAKPREREEAERLERRRRRRKLCECSRRQRTIIRRDDHLSRIFMRKLDDYADHEDIQEDLKGRLPRRRPDRVIGLGRTQTVRQYLRNMQSSYSPFKSLDVVYPFIVIEAKTAKASGANWGSIRQQTAFVVRTCLRLQQKLVAETGGSHQSLVWSFANIGEDWRLYAAIPQGTGVRTFHLWHGNVLWPEGALQLLLIIDFLCDWACDIYRESVLACLTGDVIHSRASRLTPSGTELSSQMGGSTLGPPRERSLPLRDASVHSQRPFSPPAQVPDRAEELYEIGALLTADLDASMLLGDYYHWRRWLPVETSPLAWGRSATIRHANQIELSLLRLIVPEERQVLRLFLQACFPDIPQSDAANKLLDLLCNETLAFSSSVTLESRLGSRASDPVCDARIAVYFRSSLRPTDWQVARNLVILFCSKESMWSLADVANADMTDVPWIVGNELATENIVEAMNELHFVSGTLSASLAVGLVPLCLKANPRAPARSGYTWARYCPQTEAGLSDDDFNQITSRLVPEEAGDLTAVSDIVVPYIQKQRLSYIIQAEQSTDTTQLSRSLNIPTSSTCSGVIVKKHAPSWPVAVPDFCFLVIDERVDFNDERRLAQMIAEAHQRKDWFGATKKGATFSLEDKEAIEEWVEMLAQGPTLSDGDGPSERA